MRYLNSNNLAVIQFFVLFGRNKKFKVQTFQKIVLAHCENAAPKFKKRWARDVISSFIYSTHMENSNMIILNLKFSVWYFYENSAVNY